ncbi:MAG TPA: DUF5947 family protein [Candidatus Xenobia bacterium]|jgi:hypothetical protein
MLQQFLEKPAQASVERCDMCAAELGPRHSHLVHLDDRGVLCACRGCWLLFTREGAAGGRIRAVPERIQRLAGPVFTVTQWHALQIPVSMAFLFNNSVSQQIVAFYPSPGGAMQSDLPMPAWEALVAANAALATMVPDVEALLVRGGDEGYIVPIDRCYELVGLVRREWRGLHGGEAVQATIQAYFDKLREEAA